jgi:DNA-binding NarL/FixJ family response regulator
VARHLSNIFVKLNVSSRTAAAAYAHEHRLLS